LTKEAVLKDSLFRPLSNTPKQQVSAPWKLGAIFAIGPENAGPMAKIAQGFMMLETRSFNVFERHFESGSFKMPYFICETNPFSGLENWIETSIFYKPFMIYRNYLSL
jgi:hypothetical protein